jgi:V8-like Glu-specific endopeptidase
VKIEGDILYKLKKGEVDQYPYNTIGAITGKTHADFLVKGSGALVSSNLVVTAAHCIFDGGYGRDYT